MKKMLLAAALIAVATPSFADFYVVRDATTKKCTVVDKKPTVSTTTVVGDGTVYKTLRRSHDWDEDGQGLHRAVNGSRKGPAHPASGLCFGTLRAANQPLGAWMGLALFLSASPSRVCGNSVTLYSWSHDTREKYSWLMRACPLAGHGDTVNSRRLPCGPWAKGLAAIECGTHDETGVRAKNPAILRSSRSASFRVC